MQFCQLILTEQGCQFGDKCWDRHHEFAVEFQDSVPAAEFQESSISPIMDQVPRTPPSRIDVLKNDDRNVDHQDREHHDPLTMDDVDVDTLGMDDVDTLRIDRELAIDALADNRDRARSTSDRAKHDDHDDGSDSQSEHEEVPQARSVRSVRSLRSVRSALSTQTIGREHFSVAHKIDNGLDHYYRAHGRTDYLNEDGKGKFLEMVEMNQLELGDDYDFERQFGAGMDPDDCPFIHLDDAFPLDRQYDSVSARNRVIFKVLQNCYRHGRIYRMMAAAPGIEWERFLDSSHPDHCSALDASHDECSRMMRMIEAVRYYPMVYPVASNEAWDDLVVFLNETYSSFLADYQHIMRHHHGQRDQPFLKRQTRRIQCVEENCLKQHLRELRGSGKPMHHFGIDGSSDLSENVMTLYQDLMDAVHVLFKHGHDIGIRIRVKGVAEEGAVDESEMEQFGDSQYEFVGKIRSRMHVVWVFCTPNCVSRNWSVDEEEEEEEEEEADMTDID